MTQTIRKIALRCPNAIREEAVAAATIYPGYLLKLNSADTVSPHATSGGAAELAIAIEDTYQGKTVDDSFAATAFVPYILPQRGEEFSGMLANGQTVSIGDQLVSLGDGTFGKASADGTKLYSAVAASAAVANTTDETAFDKSYTIPANFLQAGDIIRVRAQVIATATHTTDTLTLKLKIGSDVVIATAAVDVANGDIGFVDAQITIRSIGATGKLIASGVQGLGVPGTVTAKPFLLAETTVDTTATKAIAATATWSAADTGNSCRLDQLDITVQRIVPAHVLAVAREAEVASGNTLIKMRAL